MRSFLLDNSAQFHNNLINELKLKNIVFDLQGLNETELKLIEKTIQYLLKYRPYQKIEITVNIPEVYIDLFKSKYINQKNITIISKKLNDEEFYKSKIIVTNNLKTAYKEFSFGAIIILINNQCENRTSEFYYLFNSSEPRYLKDLIVWNYLSTQPEYMVANYLINITKSINKSLTHNDDVTYKLTSTHLEGTGVPGKIVEVNFSDIEKRRTIINNKGNWFISLPRKDVTEDQIVVEIIDEKEVNHS